MTTQQASEVKGLILCGGRSQRMGIDKSLIEYHGKSQREHLYHLLSHHLKQVYLSLNSEQTRSKLPTITDRYDMVSPINGIISAFEIAPNTAWLVVPCDMPFISNSDIINLLQERDPYKMATCYLGTDGLPHPLLAIYEPVAFKPLLNHVKNNISPRSFLMHQDVKFIKSAQIQSLENINTKEGYELAKKQLKKN